MAKKSYQPTPGEASGPEHEHEIHDAPHGAHLHASDYLVRRIAEATDDAERARYGAEEVQTLARTLDESYAGDDHGQALDAANRLIDLIPDDAGLLLRRGMIYAHHERLDEAVADFDRAVELAPDNPDAHFHRGIVHYQMEDTGAAIADYKQAIQLDPEHADAYMQRGYALFGTGNLNAALNDFRTYSKLYPDDPIGHNNLAFVFYQLGRTTQAEAAWGRATRLPDAPHWAFAGHAVTLMRMKKYRQAEDQLRRAVERDPRWRDALEEVAEEYSWSPEMIRTAHELVRRL